METNATDIFNAAKLAKDIGCDYFEVKPSFDPFHFLNDTSKLMSNIIKDELPDVFNSFLQTSTKEGVKNLLYSDEFLALGEVFRRHSFRYPVAMCGGDNSRPNDICFFDLSFDPDDIVNLDYSEINQMIQTGGRDTPLKKYKINKTIPVCSSKLLNNKVQQILIVEL